MAVDLCQPCTDACAYQSGYTSEVGFRQAMLAIGCGVLRSLGGLSTQAVGPAFGTVQPSSSDNLMIPAVAGKTAVLTGLLLLNGTAATDVTIESWNGTSATPRSPALSNQAAGGEVLPYNPAGWSKSILGEGLRITAGPGSANDYIATYDYR